MPGCLSALASHVESASVVSTKSKRKRKSKKKALYDQYLADSGSEDSSELSKNVNGTPSKYEYEEFEPGMDINILIQQTIQNVVQSVCLEDCDGLSQFGDNDLICFSAAVKHNSSILSLQIRYLDVSDVSLVPLCRALECHPSIRALDLSGTRGGRPSVKAVFQLVCTNPNILFVRLDDTMVSPHDAEDIRVATLYNALACPDPTNNPFYLGLLRKISDIEEEKQKYKEQLSEQLWLFSSRPQNNLNSGKEKKVGFSEKVSESRIGADVCAQFMSGRCAYGSRCRYIHPDKTTALRNAIALSKYKMAQMIDDDAKSVKSSATSLGQTGRGRLQSRLRPTNFTMNKVHCAVATVHEGSVEQCSAGSNEEAADVALRLSIWTFALVTAVCSVVLIVVY
ncbi:zinc finger protein family member, putative [Trypanosoma equiperdum]|uniref:C3H1-type domain-containing protein n=4 Tax=Trypanozoon TaxID=39700 RepID=Q57ZJ1_TRYB2|nr:hypothetical protein, conserved [Trypanosoma brucei gambiense DAL972]XP_846121.1 hypothetical protein, conserved [Trypanosoma brucei brucei TREU927]AAX79490.1 hypothetical protein, conserved [Trypanosoma brucei]RHW71416.1 zinc finger protein family member [Trypanosoma brucei equiperdum]SCU71032.1 zinc finger protein family member, putative [Trypanosoma equiperdum]AAZ12562.1 hypothetical protein, conserved [Trypanosoma brucei brucei TREU927]CBH12670.1 hypothetical protein, conserved [Trypan|eukprot:XP_011774950.1 hypothetical protein, conserved [Trypanosoma brucei gambiense DAL972]